MFVRAVQTPLVERIDGPPGEATYVLNPGDRGLPRQFDALDAGDVSSVRCPA